MARTLATGAVARGHRAYQAALVEQHISADRGWGNFGDRANGVGGDVHGVDCGVSVGISRSAQYHAASIGLP